MADRYGTKAAFIGETEGGLSITADVIVLPEPGKPKKTGLVDQYGQPIYRMREAVPFGFVGRVSDK